MHSWSVNKITFKDATVGRNWLVWFIWHSRREEVFNEILEILQDKRRVEHIGSQSWQFLVRIKEACGLGLGWYFRSLSVMRPWKMLKLAWVVLFICFALFSWMRSYGRNSWWMDVYLCMRGVCVSMCTHVWHTHPYMYVWWPDIKINCFPLSCPTLYFEIVTYWTWRMEFRLDFWPALPRSASLPSPNSSTGVTDGHHHAQLIYGCCSS